jgi:flagellar basal body-associated protein FliL
MQISKKTKIVTIVSTIVVLALAAFIFFRFFFVYSSGVNAGDLNYFQQEGIVFKTYEGKIIQSGLKSVGKSTEGLHSNELKFSVTDKAVVDKLMRASGKHIELRWKRYMGTLPWRGNSEYIATRVLSIE